MIVMTLKKKLVFFILGLSLASALIFLLIDHLTLSRARNKQKAVFAEKVVSRVTQIVENEKKRIATLCYDWAVWDAMYDYVQSPSADFEAESLPRNVVPESDLSLVLILDKSMRIVFHLGYDQESRRFIQFRLDPEARASLWSVLLRSFPRPQLESFISETEFGPLLTVSAPILHSDGKGPMNGRVVMGRLADRSFRQRVGAAIQEKASLLSVAELRSALAPGEWQALLATDSFYSEDREFLRIYRMFRNMAGQTAFAIRVDADKTLFDLQEKALRSFLAAILVCTILLGLIFYGFIDRMLLRRLTDISRKAKHVSSLADLSVRIHEDGRDEISQLGHDINTMLERLENASRRHQEMEHRLVLNEKLAATGRLAANIAHEVNNPLFAIANSIAVIKGQLKDAGGDIGEVLPLAEREIARVRKITRKLLDYGKVNLETFRESDIEAILETAGDVLALSGQIGQTAIIRSGPRGEKPILCNPDSLQQVFMNLIINASEAMAGGGEVAIRIEQHGDAYDIHFQDTGPGFSDAVRKRIFEPFNSCKDAKGAGLGLYISYHIIKRHGGGITLDEAEASPAGGASRAGAHLVVTLPRREGGNHA